MQQCRDDLEICNQAELRRSISPYNQYVNDEKAGKHVLPYSPDRTDPTKTYNLMMIPSRKPSNDNPFGESVPINYFCSFVFDLDWTQTYKIDIQRFYSL